MAGLHRRAFAQAAVAAAITATLPNIAVAASQPALSPAMTERCRVMREALGVFEVAYAKFEKFWKRYEMEHFADERFWEWYCAHPTRNAVNAAQLDARAAVEAVFMTRPATRDEDDAVAAALDAYFPVAESAFAVQCARDLFTPLSHVPPCSRKAYLSIREGLLTDPDDMFTKCDLPPFAIAMRNERKLLGL